MPKVAELDEGIAGIPDSRLVSGGVHERQLGRVLWVGLNRRQRRRASERTKNPPLLSLHDGWVGEAVGWRESRSLPPITHDLSLTAWMELLTWILGVDISKMGA